MNLINNLIPDEKSRSVGLSKRVRMSCSSVWQSGVVEFYKLCADGLFVFKKWKNVRKQVKESSGRQSPRYLISMQGIESFLGNKINMSPETFHGPSEHLGFCVIALKADFVNMIGSIFRFALRNTETTLSVNKSCEIRVIRNGKNSFKRDFLEVVNSVNRYIVSSVSKFFQFLDHSIFRMFRFFFKKIDQKQSVQLFFNQIWHEFLCEIKGFFSHDHPLINGLKVFKLFVGVSQENRPSVLLFKESKNFLICRGYSYTSVIFYGIDFLINRKTSISINVSSRVA